ncbi:MAG: polymer-forming cytoskeletal protein [Bryobacteraceae bacterium]|nr:polymer-forming cytoskeletal protein [Bryobacteraceae bacterium]
MWNRKEEERNQAQRNQPSAPAAPQQQKAPEPPRPVASATPPPVAPQYSAPAPSSSSPGGAAIIGASVAIRGDITASEDLVINGHVEGTIQLDEHRLSVGPRGKVKAQIAAREVMIQGNVEGDIEARDKITIKNDGSLVGDIRVAGIVIEDGAYFKGSIDIIRPAVEAAPAQQKKQQPPQPQAQPQHEKVHA